MGELNGTAISLGFVADDLRQVAGRLDRLRQELTAPQEKQELVDKLCEDYCKYTQAAARGNLGEEEMEEICDQCPLMRL